MLILLLVPVSLPHQVPSQKITSHLVGTVDMMKECGIKIKRTAKQQIGTENRSAVDDVVKWSKAWKNSIHKLGVDEWC